MQRKSGPKFISDHSGFVQGVAFNPRDRYLFCSGGSDGRINFYNASNGLPTTNTRITSQSATKSINAIKFNADGSRILTTTSKRLSVIDPEKGTLVNNYDNCAYSGKERAPLATHPTNPNVVVCGCTNGKGLITFDLRRHQPAHFALNIHSTVIRDIVYFDESWPFNSHEESIFSLGSDGACKIIGLDDRQLVNFDLKNRSNCICPTPESYTVSSRNGMFRSMVLIGGDNLYGYIPGPVSERLNFGTFEKQIQKMKFTSNGNSLFIATGEQVLRYRRYDRQLTYLNEVYSHKDDIVDMDISHKDEFLITASKDGSVGLMCLGVPSYGTTAFMELA